MSLWETWAWNAVTMGRFCPQLASMLESFWGTTLNRYKIHYMHYKKNHNAVHGCWLGTSYGLTMIWLNYSVCQLYPPPTIYQIAFYFLNEYFSLFISLSSARVWREVSGTESHVCLFLYLMPGHWIDFKWQSLSVFWCPLPFVEMVTVFILHWWMNVNDWFLFFFFLLLQAKYLKLMFQSDAVTLYKNMCRFLIKKD